ncbi:MAG: hypothetical protein Q4A41_05060 [Bacillota bacterium]|nr:hypothetical protein [Bacillota bacterium]
MTNSEKIVDSLKSAVKSCGIKAQSTIKPNKFPLNYKKRGYQLEPVDYLNGEKINFT